MKKVTWGLIGCGDIARKRVARALREADSSEFAAVCRAQPDLAESFAKEFGASRWYAAWLDLLKDDALDAIYIATPVHLHGAQCIAAAEAGKHVLCEKPMAMNPTECEKMIAACRANNVKLGIAYYRHFYPVIERIKEIMSAREIGQPILAQANAFEWFNPKSAEPRYWLIEPDLAGGGPMFDFGCHRIEVFLNLFGPMRTTTAVATKVLFNRAVEDTAIATFQFEQGMTGVLSVTHAAQEPQDTLEIYGSEGSIHLPVLNEGRMKIISRGRTREEVLPPAPNIHQPLVQDFVDALLQDRDPRVGGEIGKTVAEVEDQIYTKAR